MPVRKASFAISVGAICSTLYLLLHYVTNSINNAVKNPYMDEIFHVPQAQKYCEGDFSYYDKKITTPPGLYLLSYARIWLRDRVLIQRNKLICDTLDLRRTNHLVAVFNLVVVIFIQLSTWNRAKMTRRSGMKQQILYTLNHITTLDLIKILLRSIIVISLPPLFFFNSLFYTDAGSTLFTLLSYFFSTVDQHTFAAILGFASTLFRQTNIVWIFYFACLTILRTIDEHQQRRRDEKTPNQTFLNLLLNRNLIKDLTKRCLPYAIVGTSFVAFLIFNGDIVLGDKEAHQAKFHLAQVLYFLGFCSVFGAAWLFHLRILRRFLYFTIRSPLIAVVASFLIILVITFGRYAHPYLLADNRHITFYIWRRILDRHNSYVPYLLTPIYLLTSFSIWHYLRNRGCKHLILYTFCTMLVIVPNGLLEPRYFLIPYILLRLNAETGLLSLLLEFAENIAINAGIHYLFLHKTFRWSDSPEIQRIMW